MKVRRIHLSGIRSYPDSGPIDMGPITLIVGRNNSGKSSILRSLAMLQQGATTPPNSLVRFGQTTGEINIEVSDVEADRFLNGERPLAEATIRIRLNRATSGDGSISLELNIPDDANNYSIQPFENREPSNFVYTFFSNRRTNNYESDVSTNASFIVAPDLSYLPAKVDRLGTTTNPAFAEFTRLVEEVVGLPVASVTAEGGKQVGVYLTSTESLLLNQLGDGVAQLLGLIVQLVDSNEKLFLIEEIENDVHPQALRALLDVILEKSSTNQFVISTHNNQVVRHLGAIESTVLYDLRSSFGSEGIPNLAETTIARVGSSTEDRTALLSWLGYELSDLYLFDGWIIFEESSAERVVREFLIPNFTPRLVRVRTVAANGAGDIDRTFNALDKLVLFTHLQDRYAGRTLVVADGDPAGENAIARLRASYPAWDSSNFRTLSKPDFEAFYPPRFAEQRDHALSETDTQERRRLKRELLAIVLQWLREESDQAVTEFEVSAREVIELLTTFERRFE